MTGLTPDADLIAFVRARLDDREADARRRDADHTQYGPTELWPDDLRAEVAAKRAIVAECARPDRLGRMHRILFLLASAYADHPDYRPEWKP